MSVPMPEKEFLAGDPPTFRRDSGPRRALVLLGVILIGAFSLSLLTLLLGVLSGHLFAGNSDGATVVLEGSSMNSGNLLLHGWGLSNDSFWSVDALFYLVFVHFAGVTRAALHAVPAFIAALVLLVGLLAVREESRVARGALGGGFLLIALALPSPDLGYFLLQGPWHVGTALWCLIAFVGLAQGHRRFGFVLAILALVAGLLGDLETLAIGVIPIAFVGLTEMVRSRSARAGLPRVAVAGISLGLFYGLRHLLHALGGFTLSNGITHAPSSRYLLNLGHAMSSMASLFGAGRLAIGPRSALGAQVSTNGSIFTRVAGIAMLVLVLASVATAIVVLVRGCILGDGSRSRLKRPSHLDALLLAGAFGSIGSYMVLSPNNNADYARYLSSGAIFVLILTARSITRVCLRLDSREFLLASVLALSLLGADSAVAMARSLSAPAAPVPSAALASFLEAHHLDLGIGDYWSASIVTVSSGSRVVIRPVITNNAGKITRFGRQSDASWYARTRFEFLVYDVRHPWREINATTAITTFGRPKIAYVVGNYRVITWPGPITVSAKGFTRG